MIWPLRDTMQALSASAAETRPPFSPTTVLIQPTHQALWHVTFLKRWPTLQNWENGVTNLKSLQAQSGLEAWQVACRWCAQQARHASWFLRARRDLNIKNAESACIESVNGQIIDATQASQPVQGCSRLTKRANVLYSLKFWVANDGSDEE